MVKRIREHGELGKPFRVAERLAFGVIDCILVLIIVTVIKYRLLCTW